ncbi:MAG: phosphoribosylformylglycinamidine synthase subunit PurQ [Thermodesulfobacteriota bacterium]|nr:phosphoribosylformylglycinamidine synthase subunit PurQ [Thermodesulfobacteriota bacterium]
MKHSNTINVLVLTGYGLNCDNETAHAFELAGAEVTRVHINSLIDGSVILDDFKIMVFGGGFSWGDDHGAGVIQAVRMKTNIGEHILEFIHKGNLVLGICNGFQTLVNMGLLPGLDKNYQKRSVAITFNDCGNFIDRWVTLKVNKKSPCIFTTGLDQLEFPVRHGEGKFYSDGKTIDRLVENHQVAVYYAIPDGKPAQGKFPFNPNGSLQDIAGICDPTGRIFGLMPHPEAYNHPTNHPDWTRHKEKQKRRQQKIDPDPTIGIRIFKNAVDYIRQA